MDTNNEHYYDSAAAHYDELSAIRSKYLRSVDQIIIQALKNTPAKNILDIGTGDGKRIKYLSETLGVENLVAIESSRKMASKAIMQLGAKNVLFGNISEVALPENYFNAVFSLWNVFGHISNYQARVAVLDKISKSLTPTGKCIIDVNNRYNARFYGWFAVFCNIYKDIVKKKNRGWFPIKIDGVNGNVYIHRPSEFNNYLSGVNLAITDIYYIDYESGERRRSLWEGQCVYILNRRR